MSIQIISHRGFWKNKSEQNSESAFFRSLSEGYGIETDIRDYKGNLVIAHDIADENSILLNELFLLYLKIGDNLTLALNIKADGLHKKIKEFLLNYDIDNYFVFDMSIPETISYKESQVKYFTRLSEYEPIPTFYDHACGVWIDCFVSSDWINQDLLNKHIKAGKMICIVSPELHQRDPMPFWESLLRVDKENDYKLMICTDYPDKARGFFYE